MLCFQYFRAGPHPAYPLYDVAVLGRMRIAKVSPYAIVTVRRLGTGATTGAGIWAVLAAGCRGTASGLTAYYAVHFHTGGAT